MTSYLYKVSELNKDGGKETVSFLAAVTMARLWFQETEIDCVIMRGDIGPYGVKDWKPVLRITRG